MNFFDVPIRQKGEKFAVEWVNTLRQAGIDVPQWYKYTVDKDDFAAAGLTNDIELVGLTGLQLIHGVLIKHSEAFSGGSITEYRVSVGITGQLEKYANKFDVFQSVSDTAKEVTQVLDIESFVSTTSIRVAAESVGGNLNTALNGSVDIYLLISKLPV